MALRVLRAANLPAVNPSSLRAPSSDPFVELRILHPATQARQHHAHAHA